MSDNTLGLQLNPEESTPPAAVEEPQSEPPQSPTDETRPRENRAKGGYVNPDRVKTGGAQREKLNEDELAERMKRIRLQNEKIKQRRLDVEADKAAFQKTQQEERAKQNRNRQVQADINKKRDEVARRKMEKAGNREWDSGKPAASRAAKNLAQEVEKEKPAAEVDASWGKQEAAEGKEEVAVDDSWAKQETETTDDGWAKEGPTDDGWAKKPEVDVSRDKQVDSSWDKQVAKEESQPATSGWDTLGEYADVEIPPEPEQPPPTDDGWGAPADPADVILLDMFFDVKSCFGACPSSSTMVRGILLTSNLPQLQNLIKRDPAAYKEEFLQQWNHYNSIREIFAINPDEQADHFGELVTFISQVATCYPKETAQFPAQISTLLLESYNVLALDTKKTLVQNLVMLRNKGVTSSIDLMKTLFPLLPQTPSSNLRVFIRKTILNDIKTANLRTKNHKLNNAVQAMLFGMIERGIGGEFTGDKGKTKMANLAPESRKTSEEAMWAIILAKELWRKGIWRDAKTVAIIAQGCFHPVNKAQSASLHFFLGDEDEEGDSDEEDEGIDVKGLLHQREINKKTRSGERRMRKQVKAARKSRKTDEPNANFSALQLLRDPQTFGEKLYDILHNHDKKFTLDHKILIMQLLSRIMGSHKLCVLGFYTYIVKYLFHKQLRIPAILASLAQSVHDLTPPDALTPVIRKLAQEFVHPGVANEVIAAGINSIREVCRRQPWAMEEDLLSDLIEYRKSRDKQVVAASRGLLRLYREVNPGMLKKRERGKEATMAGLAGAAQPLPYGHAPEAAMDIDGLAMLEDHLKELEDAKDGDEESEDEWKGWDVESDSSDSDSESDGWVAVSDDDGDLDISDSEDEKEKKDEEMKDPEAETVKRISTLATTKILTPADFALLNSLKASSSAASTSKNKRKSGDANDGLDTNNEFISENDILGPRKKAKADYEERMASIRAGREGREKFGSKKGKQNKAQPSSSTNREKARNKPFQMIMGSNAVKSKKKASLREKQRKLRAHIKQSKR